LFDGITSQNQMTVMNRIERAAEDADRFQSSACRSEGSETASNSERRASARPIFFECTRSAKSDVRKHVPPVKINV
jgi:hypothetical protein